MNPAAIDSASTGLLVDTNLLVLFVVGSVNRNRIGTFKRTCKYTRSDFDLLCDVLARFDALYTIAHVMAEVSNLTDLPGPERLRARSVLKETISRMLEVDMPSARASEDPIYQSLGLVDAAINAASRARGCSVLTDDLDLYLRLSHHRVDVINFTHLQARNWGM